MAIDWDAIYADELNRLPDSTEQYNTQMNADIDALTTQRDSSASKLQNQLKEALTQAYINQELAKRDLPAQLANQGLGGGLTETAYSDILSSHRNATNAANKSYTDADTELNNTYGTNVAGIRSDYGNRILAAMDARRQQAQANANTRYQNELAQQQWEWQKEQAEKQAAAASQSTQIIATGNGSESGTRTPASYQNTGGSGAQGQAYTGGKAPTSTAANAYLNPKTNSWVAQNSYKNPKTGQWVYF